MGSYCITTILNSTHNAKFAGGMEFCAEQSVWFNELDFMHVSYLCSTTNMKMQVSIYGRRYGR